jgi:N-acetylneuraminate synthase
MEVSAFKIGSGECNNYPLVDHIASFGKPIILSTGMNSIESVAKSVELFRQRRVPFALLHCTNVYPTPPRLVRLGAMTELASAFPDAVIGLTDHTTPNYACLGAVALGASILERHFTDSMDRPGPDIVCSMDEASCADLIRGAHEIFEARGGHKGPLAEEAPTIAFAYASVVTIAPLEAGEPFTRDNVWVKRPGTGQLPAERFEEVLGKRAARDLPSDVQIAPDDILDWTLA